MALIRYRLKFNLKDYKKPQTYSSNGSVRVGDVIEIEAGDFRYVARVRCLVFGPQLGISEPCNSYDLAYLLSIKQGYRLE